MAKKCLPVLFVLVSNAFILLQHLFSVDLASTFEYQSMGFIFNSVAVANSLKLKLWPALCTCVYVYMYKMLAWRDGSHGLAIGMQVCGPFPNAPTGKSSSC